MSGEFDVEVRNAIRALRTEVESLAKSQGKLNDSVRSYAKEAHQAFNAPPKLPTEHTVQFGKALHEVGHALRGIGGPLGEIVHKLTGGAGMEGGLSRVAVAAGVAGLALEAFNVVTEKRVEDVERAIEAEEKYYQAIEKGRAVQKQQAEAGLAQAPNRRHLLAAGGQEAVDAAENIAKNGGGAVSAEEAERGTAQIYAKYGRTGRARSTLDLANQLAKTGIGFQSAVDELLKAGGNVNDAATGDHIAAMIYQRKIGRVGNADAIYKQALSDVQGDPLLGAAHDSGVFKNGIRGIQRDRAVTEGVNDARGDLAAATDPIGNAINEVQKASERQVANLERAAKEQGAIAAGWENFKMVFGQSKGSKEQQALRARRTNAAASLDAGSGLNPDG